MSTSFVPPRPDQWEGPAQQASFTPPPVDSWQGPAKDLGEANQAFDKIEKGAPYRFAQRLVGNLNPTPLLNAVAHPIDTGKAMVEESGKRANEAIDAVKQGKIGRAALSAAEAVPLVGPMVSQAEQDVKQGNLAGVAGTAASVLAPEALSVGLRGARATGLPGKAAEALEGSAERQYSRVLGPTTKPNKVRASNVVGGYDAPAPELGPGATVPMPGLIDRGVKAVTRKGLSGKFHDTVADLAGKLENEWQNLPPDQGIPTNQVEAELNRRAADQFAHRNPTSGVMGATGPDAQRGLDFIDELKGYLKTHEVTGPGGKGVIPWDSLRRFRQDWDGIANAANGYAGSDLTTNVKAASYRAAANGIRDLLNGANPNISAINREMHFWKQASDVIDATLQRTQSQAKPLGRKMARVVGQGLGFSSAGPAGAVLGGEVMDAIEGAITSPAWQTVSAVAKDRLAQAIATGDPTFIKGALRATVGANVAQPPQIQVPRFAKGGIIRKPTVGLVGEAGPERIQPVESLRQTAAGRDALASLPEVPPVERSSALPTVPEKPETLKAQLEQLASGARRAVMFPKGSPLMKRPPGMRSYQDRDGNTFVYNPSLTSQPEIDKAAQENRLPELLGATDGGMGAPDKSALNGEPAVVTGKDGKGNPVQSTATDAPNLPRAMQQTKKVTPKGGSIEVAPAEKEIGRRLKKRR